jgi:HlyD family secretion protein
MIAVSIAVLLFVFFPRKNKQETYTVKPIDIDYTIQANCTVKYPEPYNITAQADSEVQKVYVSEGMNVKKGQLLVQLDDFKERQSFAISSGNLESAKNKLKNAKEDSLPKLSEQLKEDESNLSEAKKNMERLSRLEKSGAVSKAEAEKAENIYKQTLSRYNQTKLTMNSISTTGAIAELESSVNILTAEAKLAKKSLDDKSLIAPYDGVITKVNVKEKETAQKGTVIITIIERSSWILETNVDQKELPYLNKGVLAYVVFDSYPQEKIKAEIYFVCTNIDMAKGTCNLKLEIKEEKKFIKYGMTGNAEIFSAKYGKVLGIPSRFVGRTNGDAFVKVIDNGKLTTEKLDYTIVGEKWVIAKNIKENSILVLPDAKP